MRTTAIRLWRIDSLHWSTRIVLLLVLSVFVWLNFDQSRDLYEENVDGAWRGGVRHGFPMTAYDGGGESHASLKKGKLSLTMREYRDWQYGGLAINTVFLLAVLGGAGLLWERKVRNYFPAFVARVEPPSLHWAAYPIILLSGAVLMWANLNVHTRLVEYSDGRHDYLQEMGWPLKFYLASQPDKSSLPMGSEALSRSEKLVLLQSNPSAWYRQAHWSFGIIVLNLGLGLGLMLGAACGMHLILKRRAKIAAVVVLPAKTD